MRISDWSSDVCSSDLGWIHRKYFELAVLAQVKDELKSGDLYIPHGERYDDYREQLVDEATFAQELDAYGEVSGIATDAADFVQGLRNELTTLADAVDARFPDNLRSEEHTSELQSTMPISYAV